MEKYSVVGLMSGTSLDGLDIAHCILTLENGHWSYTIRSSQTLLYHTDWKQRLAGAASVSGHELSILNKEYGRFIGKTVNAFIRKHGIKNQFISSHGHTVFHEPSKKITLQVGDGASIAAETGIPVVCDFRTLDVALGGQGAPLVPIGDKLLFREYTACLNLGGIANISYHEGEEWLAFDISPVNIVLNDLAQKFGKAYDNKGALARSGKLNSVLLAKLNVLPFYRVKPPKSLGKEWLNKYFQPILDSFDISTEDKLRTVTEHAALQIGKVLNGIAEEPSSASVLVTGGGAFNEFLVERIASYTTVKIVIPEKELVMFKEALIFAFLGVLRWRGEVNTLRSVTGASHDSSGGCIYTP
jgi:anhydro-N-acetylmuramic acid kinase